MLIDALDAAKVRWFVEPGLSSSLVAPLLAGVALTDAELSKRYAHVCSRLLTYAHVCLRMLTYADVC